MHAKGGGRTDKIGRTHKLMPNVMPTRMVLHPSFGL